MFLMGRNGMINTKPANMICYYRSDTKVCSNWSILSKANAGGTSARPGLVYPLPYIRINLPCVNEPFCLSL